MTECWLMHWHVVVINLSYCADWCTVIKAYYELTHCSNKRTGLLILSNCAYPAAHLCFNQSEWVTWMYLLIVLMSQASCEVSHDHMMQIVRNKCREVRVSVTSMGGHFGGSFHHTECMFGGTLGSPYFSLHGHLCHRRCSMSCPCRYSH